MGNLRTPPNKPSTHFSGTVCSVWCPWHRSVSSLLFYSVTITHKHLNLTSFHTFTCWLCLIMSHTLPHWFSAHLMLELLQSSIADFILTLLLVTKFISSQCHFWAIFSSHNILWSTVHWHTSRGWWHTFFLILLSLVGDVPWQASCLFIWQLLLSSQASLHHVPVDGWKT